MYKQVILVSFSCLLLSGCANQTASTNAPPKADTGTGYVSPGTSATQATSTESTQTVSTTSATATATTTATATNTQTSPNTSTDKPGADVSEASATVTPYTDLKDIPHKEMIEDLHQIGVFEGRSPEFNPKKPITRAEYALWLFRAYNAMHPDKKLRILKHSSPVFTDVKEGDQTYDAICALATAGFDIGYIDETFEPDKPLRRQALIMWKVNVDEGKTYETWPNPAYTAWKFTDDLDIPGNISPYVNQDFLIGGTGGSNIERCFGKIRTFKPKEPVLRYQAALSLWQMGNKPYVTAKDVLEGKVK